MVQDKIMVYVDVFLTHPYSISFDTLLEFSRIYGIRVLSGQKGLEMVSLLIPSKKFKLVFGENSKVKEFIPHKKLVAFITKVKINKIEAKG